MLLDSGMPGAIDKKRSRYISAKVSLECDRPQGGFQVDERLEAGEIAEKLAMRVIFRSEELLGILRALSPSLTRVPAGERGGREPSYALQGRGVIRLGLTAEHTAFSVQVPVVDSVDAESLRLPIAATRRAVEMLESELVFLTRTAQGRLKLSGRFGRSFVLRPGRLFDAHLPLDAIQPALHAGSLAISARELVRLIRRCARDSQFAPGTWSLDGVRFDLRNDRLFALATDGRAFVEAWTSRVDRVWGTRPSSQQSAGPITSRGLLRLARWLSPLGNSAVQLDLRREDYVAIQTLGGSVAYLECLGGRLSRSLRKAAGFEPRATITFDRAQEFRSVLRQLIAREPCRPYRGIRMSLSPECVRLQGMHDFGATDVRNLPVETTGILASETLDFAFEPESLLAVFLHEARPFTIRVPSNSSLPLCFSRGGHRFGVVPWDEATARHRRIRCDSCMVTPVDFISIPPQGWEHWHTLDVELSEKLSVTDEGRCPNCSRHDELASGSSEMDFGDDFFDED